MITEIIKAHDHCRNHREELLKSELCGCFFCLAIFKPWSIREWLDVENGRAGPTALCPNCGIDAVIGSKSGYPITQEFLKAMEKYWFDTNEFMPNRNPIFNPRTNN